MNGERSKSLRLGWLVGVGASLLAGLPAAGEPAGERRELTLLVTAGLSGRLVDEDGATTVAALVATVRREAAAMAAAGREVVVLDAGRTLVPYAESRFDGGETMIRVLAAAGCQVFAPSALDLSLGLAQLERLAAQAGFPVLRPFTSGETVAGRLAPGASLELTGGLRLAVVDLFDPLFAGDLADFGVDAAQPLGPKAAFAQLESADALRVAILHSKLHSPELERRELTWKLVEEPHGIDLVINPDLGHDLSLRRETDAGPVHLAGFRLRDEQPWSVRRLDLGLERRAGSWSLESLASRVVEVDAAAPRDPALEREILRTVARFREVQGKPLPEGSPERRAELERFILEAVREAAASEIVALSRGALRPVHPSQFAAAPLKREAVVRLLSLDLQIGVVELTGEELEELVGESAGRLHGDGTPRKDSLVFLGLTRDGKEIEVNGRPLHPEDRYRVATSTNLLAGGDNYPQLRGREAELVAAPGEVAAAGERLQPSRQAEVREDVVLPRLARAREPFVDLERRAVWRFGVDELGLYLDGVQTDRDPAYDAAPDSRANAIDSSTVRADIRLRADRELVQWSWENRLEASFGLLNAEGTETREVDDDLRIESSAVFTKLRFLGGEPFLGVALETEFRRNPSPEGGMRPRQLEQSLAAGLDWARGRWQRLRLGAVARHYSNADPANRSGFEAEGHYRLSPSGKWPGFEGRFLLDSLRGDAQSVDRIDVGLRLLVPMWRTLELSPAFNYYNYRDSTFPGSADYYRFSLGLSYFWTGKYQNLD